MSENPIQTVAAHVAEHYANVEDDLRIEVSPEFFAELLRANMPTGGGFNPHCTISCNGRSLDVIIRMNQERFRVKRYKEPVL